MRMSSFRAIISTQGCCACAHIFLFKAAAGREKETEGGWARLDHWGAANRTMML